MAPLSRPSGVRKAPQSGRIGDAPVVQDFCYRKLASPYQDLRLLRIHPRSTSNLIECTISHVTRSSKPAYDCLSYTWGNTKDLEHIFVNGQVLQVTKNLVNALTNLRDWKHQTYRRNALIWIDAICINQKDEDEKGHQVQAMRDIYSDAAQVIIWLGERTEQSSDGIWMISHLMEKFAIADDVAQQAASLTAFCKELHDRNGNDNRYMAGIEDVYGRPWWSRVWIVQEAVVAKNAWIACGVDAIDFEHIRRLEQIANQLRGFNHSEETSSWLLGIANSLSNVTAHTRAITQNWGEATLPDALEMMYMGRDIHSTDPRDRIYALLGITNDTGKLGITVDYSKTYETLFEQCTRKLLQEYGLDILSCCSPATSRFRKSTLPSWVPDWTRFVCYHFGGLIRPGLYNASGESQQQSRYDGGPGKLHLSGVKLSEITRTRDAWPYVPRPVFTGEENSKAEWLWVEDVQRLAKQLELTEEEREILTMRVASADMIEQENLHFRRMEVNHLLNYRAFLALMNYPEAEEPNFDQDKFNWLTAQSQHYRTALYSAAEARRPILTASGQLGIAPESSRIGDIVCIFHGAAMPFVLRQLQDGEYRLLGAAFVHGIMDGEAMQSGRTDIFVLS